MYVNMTQIVNLKLLTLVLVGARLGVMVEATSVDPW